MTRTDLINAAEDLNEQLGLDPAIDTSLKLADLRDAVKDGGLLLQVTDQPSPETIEVLKQLEWGDLGSDVLDVFQSLGIMDGEVEEEPEEEPEVEEVEEEPEVEEKPTPPKKKAEKKPGVIATIVAIIEKAGKTGVTKEEILEKLVAEFPERASIPMKNTINVQVPGRITKERFPLEKLDNGKYRKAN